MKERIAVLLVASLLFGIFVPINVNAYEEKVVDGKQSDSLISTSNYDFPESDIQIFDTTIAEKEVTIEKTNGNKATFVSQTSMEYIADNNPFEKEYIYETDFKYDAMTVTFYSSDGIVLHSNSYKEVNLTDKSITISFTPQNPYIDDDEKNVFDYKEDKVVAAVSFWNDEEITYTEIVDLSVLYTPYGTFVSDIDPILSKRNYCRYLLNNDLIDEATYEDLNVMFHCYSNKSSNTPVLKVGEHDKTITTDEQLKLVSAYSDKYTTNSDGVVVASATEKKDYVEVIYQIQQTYDDNLQVLGHVYWYDKDGTQFPAQFVKVEIMDQDVSFDDLVTTVITDSSGYFNVHFANQIIEYGRDIYLKVYSGNNESMVYDFGIWDLTSQAPVDSIMAEPYYFTTSVTTDVQYGHYELEGYSSNHSLVSKAFSIANALYYAREYEKSINGGVPLNDTVVSLYYPMIFDSKINTSFTVPIFDKGQVFLTEDKYSDWGVILHEYGHAMEDKMDIFVGYEQIASKTLFFHEANKNLTDYYEGDKDKALKISWNEGWASYYSICVQRKYLLENAGYPGTSQTTIFNGDIVNDGFYGEDHELAIAAAITQVVDANIVSEEELWNLVKENQPLSFHEFYEMVLYEIMTNATTTSLPSTLNRYLTILEKQNISAKTSIDDVRYDFSSYSPTFSWTAPSISPGNQNGFVFNYQYSVAIVSFDPPYSYESPPTSNTSFTIPTSAWVDVIEKCTNGFYWTIITKEVTDPVSGGYYSGLNRMKYQPKEINISSHTRYTEDRPYVLTGKCYDYKVKFNVGGTKLVQTFGTKDTVLELYSSDGTLLLGRANTDDKGYELNALFSYNFTANTEYIIRIRFFSTNVSGAVKLAIVPTYSHANYESAYGTYGITTVSWKLGIDKVALFRYKFSSDGDVTFTMSADDDTYLYVIEPWSTELLTEYDGSNFDSTNLYDDDSGEYLQAQLTKTVEANKEYLVIISFYSPHASSGDFSINTSYAS